VKTTSIGRIYTDEETELEAHFCNFLTSVVEGTDKSLRIIYQAAHQHSELVLYSSGYLREKEHERTLTIKVLSPAFYSRFVHYSHAQEAFDREALATDEKNRTVIVEPPHLLPILLDAIKQATSTSHPSNTNSPLTTLRWSLLHHLRCPPADPAYPSTTTPSPSTTTSTTITDIRTFPRSELDSFARHQSPSSASAAYRRTCTKLFLAQRFTLGFPVLVTLLDLVFRAVLLLVAIAYSSQSEVFDVLRPREHTTKDVGEIVVLLLLANGVHLWSLVKG
jgi:hypothetical protein